jgi:DNA-binding PadR family transcriptional regulator
VSASEPSNSLERDLLLHLLEHRANEIRFEADQWTTEYGIGRKFAGVDPTALKNALRNLEVSRLIFRRSQYVVGYSEPKHIFSLTPSGHRRALTFRQERPA